MKIELNINDELRALLRELSIAIGEHPPQEFDRNIELRRKTWTTAIRVHALGQLYAERFGESPQSRRAVAVAEAFIKWEVLRRSRRNETLDAVAEKCGEQTVAGLYE